MFWSTQPATMEKQKRRTKTAAWWTFTEGKGREGQRMAICQWAPPAADENTRPWLLAKTPPLDPPPLPLLPFQCLRLTANILLQCLRCQEDLSFNIFGLPSAGHRGALGGGGSQPNAPSPPFRPPPLPPLLIHPGRWGMKRVCRGQKLSDKERHVCKWYVVLCCV